MANQPAIVGGVIALAAIVGATIAVCLGHIDASSYTGIVGVALGGGLGAGAHAAGVTQSKR